MTKVFNWCTTTIMVVGICMAGNAFATNGYFTHGIGTKNKAMAGAGIALPEDAIDVTNNPAVAPFVGDQLIVGAALFSPIRKYETFCTSPPMCANGYGGAFTIGPNKIKSGSNYHIIPHIAKSWQLNNGSAWALSFYGRGGMNTDWQGGTATFDHDRDGVPSTFPGTFGAGDAGVNLSQAFLDITWAKKMNDRFSLGVSAVLVAQYFKADGVMSFAPFTETFAKSGGMTFPSNLSNNGTDWSYGGGVKLGLHTKITDKVSLGIMYQSEIKMTEFDDYADLYADQGGFDIPANFKIGLSIQASPNAAVSLDIEHIWYSDIGSVGNPVQNLFNCPTLNPMSMDTSYCLGGNNGGGFGWEDMTVYKAGLRVNSGENLTWRLGYSYGKQPIPEDQMTFNILAPATIQQHFTAGFTFEKTKGREFNVAVMVAPTKSLSGPNNFDPTQTVTFKMYEWELEASYAWRF